VENEVLLMQQFEEIEMKVERLIAICSSLDIANKKLKNIVTNMEIELQEKSLAIQNLSEERSMIRSKIDTLLVKLENIVDQDENSLQ
jgi:hypothetical protein